MRKNFLLSDVKFVGPNGNDISETEKKRIREEESAYPKSLQARQKELADVYRKRHGL